MNKCKGLWGFFFGHKIEVALDCESELPPFTKLSAPDATFIEALRKNKETVVAFYCIRCGKQFKMEKD